ncbi:hypothetical protein C1752_06316 [Acaryochloris thomasi RCC1774]|uniref:Uncharacterized protein n=1 Tax=Acaryochloris thomasi RCC1774 TaxID=1764569 RepID=A0A2W1JRN7_9CYAN|nr:hypothetical protein C1752_06316 [Acaryochloris thomasi RCC1774]
MRVAEKAFCLCCAFNRTTACSGHVPCTQAQRTAPNVIVEAKARPTGIIDGIIDDQSIVNEKARVEVGTRIVGVAIAIDKITGIELWSNGD